MTKSTIDSEIKSALDERNIPEHRQDFFADLASQLADIEVEAPVRHQNPHHVRRTIAWTTPVAIAAAAVLVVAVVNGGGPATKSQTPQLATPTSQPGSTPTSEIRPLLAADVIAKATTAVGSIHTMSGTTTDKFFANPASGLKASQSVTQFRLNDSGDQWSSATDDTGTTLSSFIAATGDSKTYNQKLHQASETTNYEPAPAASSSPFSSVIGSNQQLATSQNPTLQSITYDGQPAWQISVSNVEDGSSFDAYNVTLLQSTALPVHVLAYEKGVLEEEVTVTDLKVNPDLSASDFDVTIPAGVKVNKNDAGVVPVPASGVEALASYKQFVPQYLPSGFMLSTITVQKDSGQGVVLGSDGNGIVEHNVVNATYRKGLQALYVRTESSNGLPASKWADPLGTPDYTSAAGTSTGIKLVGGAFDGVPAHVVSGGYVGNHVYAIGAHWVLTVHGDPSTDEMVKVAQSVQQ